MPKRNGMSETKEENIKQGGFNLNDSTASPNAELGITVTGEKYGMELVNALPNNNFSESGLKAECDTDSLVGGGMKRTPNDHNMENIIKMRNKKTVELRSLDREVRISRRVLRSASAARGPANSGEHHMGVAEKGNYPHEEDLSKGVYVSSTSSVNEVKDQVKHEHWISPLPKETHGDACRSDIKVEYKDERSADENASFEPHENEMQVKRKRGRPRKLQISSQSDERGSILNYKLGGSLYDKEKLVMNDDEEKPIGRSYFDGANRELKFEHEQSVEAKKIVGPDFRSQVEVEIKGNSSYDGNGNVEPHDEEPKVKRKRGRPRKLQIGSQSYESGCNTNCKLAKTPDLSSQSSVGRPNVKRQRGRPPKTKETKSGGTDESAYKAKKRLKLRDSTLGSWHTNTLNDGERRFGQQQNKQNDAGEQSRSKSKKMLSERILQLLLAAGWTVEYRPRNGRLYNDAVYVNPAGKTHWSVTKAYKVYKEHLESSMNDQMNSTTGSGFGLLPEEDLHLLERKIQKKRCDKGKRRPTWKDSDTNENMVSTKGIGKSALHGQKVQKVKVQMQKLIRASQGKKKRKWSHGSHKLERISAPVRKIKREEKHNRKRCAPSARSSLENANSKENGYILFEGKRTMLGWMIDSAIVPVNGKVHCMSCEKTQVLLEGIITKDGIQCSCCDEVFSVLDFEVHAGGKSNKPFKSLYLEGGGSLLQCLLECWNKHSESQLKWFHFVDFGGGDPNDDTCGICGDGGDLICCDGCPSTFHQSCLDIEKFPSGAWFCCYCSCKFCEKVETVNHDTATLPPLSSCRLCEEKYHEACIKQGGAVPGERSTDSFCGKYCQELFEGLQLLIGVKHPLPEGFSWTFLRRVGIPCEISDCDIYEKIAYNAKLAVAFSVMDECFSPLVDHRSGVNLLQNIVYNFGSNFHRLNYSSFLTAVLERGDEIIAVASIRIHGIQLAEMPFIGTRYMYRRQGMCRRLMEGIESVLGSLKVEKLVIPAVPEVMDTWTSGFGFRPVNESGKKTIKKLNLLVFPGVDMLEKSLVKEKISDSSSDGYLPLAPEMSLAVDVEEKKPEDSKEQNCATAGVESPCLKSMNLEEGVKEVDALPDADNHRESNSPVANESYANQINTKTQEDNTPLSDHYCFGAPDCYIIDDSKPHGNNGFTAEEIDKKTLAVKREVTSTLRVSPRLVQNSWRASPVKQKYTGTNAVLLDSPHRYV